MTVLFIGGRLDGQQRFNQQVAEFYEHTIQFRHGGVFIERYQNIGHGMSPLRQLARYVGLRRLNELPRHFNPARLPD